MRNPQGYIFSFDPVGSQKEADTFTCNHCNRVVIVVPKCDPADLGGHCKLCDKLICPSCVDENECKPFIQKIEKEEELAYRWRQNFRM